MFTGIVQAVGTVERISRRATGARIVLSAPGLSRPIADGASICVSGTCLTVVSSDAVRIEFDAVHETLERTTLVDLAPGSRVNLEPSLRPSDRMDGHHVQGHVEGTGSILRVSDGSAGQLWRFEAPAELIPFIIPKGSIAIDGISLTIADIAENSFSVALIPTTLELTTLGRARVGDRVNIETDILVRTIVTTMRRYFGAGRPDATAGSGLTLETLLENGW
jgi:riboflavin synthase alpha subunit